MGVKQSLLASAPTYFGKPDMSRYLTCNHGIDQSPTATLWLVLLCRRARNHGKPDLSGHARLESSTLGRERSCSARVDRAMDAVAAGFRHEHQGRGVHFHTLRDGICRADERSVYRKVWALPTGAPSHYGATGKQARKNRTTEAAGRGRGVRFVQQRGGDPAALHALSLRTPCDGEHRPETDAMRKPQVPNGLACVCGVRAS